MKTSFINKLGLYLSVVLAMFLASPVFSNHIVQSTSHSTSHDPTLTRQAIVNLLELAFKKVTSSINEENKAAVLVIGYRLDQHIRFVKNPDNRLIDGVSRIRFWLRREATKNALKALGSVGRVVSGLLSVI